MPRPLYRVGGMMRVWRLSVAYIGPKSRKDRPYRKTKIGTEVAHVTRDSDTTFIKVKRSKVNLQGAGALFWWPPAQLIDGRLLREYGSTDTYTYAPSGCPGVHSVHQLACTKRLAQAYVRTCDITKFIVTRTSRTDSTASCSTLDSADSV